VLAAADESECEHVRVPVDPCGRVDLDALRAALADGALLVNLQHATHEVGTFQPSPRPPRSAARLTRSFTSTPARPLDG
jgi:cysteine sulfinate desulfinase/cysteine desulfurase-like protein